MVYENSSIGFIEFLHNSAKTNYHEKKKYSLFARDNKNSTLSQHI